MSNDQETTALDIYRPHLAELGESWRDTTTALFDQQSADMDYIDLCDVEYADDDEEAIGLAMTFLLEHIYKQVKERNDERWRGPGNPWIESQSPDDFFETGVQGE